MSGLVIDGVEHQVPGLDIRNWHDDPEMSIGPIDGRRRKTRQVQSIGLHATVGDEPQIVLPGAGAPGLARRTVRAWHEDDLEDRHAGGHLIVDADGTIWCLADLLRDVTFHAEAMNELSVGIEIAQSQRLEIRQVQVSNTVRLCDAVTLLMGIQRAFHSPYLGEDKPVARLAAGGKDFVGIFCHRDQTTRRGPGDPGNAIVEAIGEADYDAFNVEEREDIVEWSFRQRRLNQRGAKLTIDGIPGPATRAALQALMLKPGGMWVPRPGDPTTTAA